MLQQGNPKYFKDDYLFLLLKTIIHPSLKGFFAAASFAAAKKDRVSIEREWMMITAMAMSD